MYAWLALNAAHDRLRMHAGDRDAYCAYHDGVTQEMHRPRWGPLTWAEPRCRWRWRWIRPVGHRRQVGGAMVLLMLFCTWHCVAF